jgi:putative transposase
VVVLVTPSVVLQGLRWGAALGPGCLAVSSGTINDEMIQEYIEEQEGEPVHDDSRFPIDNP